MNALVSSFISTRISDSRPASMFTAFDTTKRVFTRLSSSRNGMPPLDSLVPEKQNIGKLFLTGATLGPAVDSLHNQCLLEYDRAPINMFLVASQANPADQHYLFSSSFFIPPLLGIAYVVLGGILPRIFQYFLPSSSSSSSSMEVNSQKTLRNKAILAVLSTALIIRLSEFLQTQQPLSGDDGLFLNLNNIIMNIAALSQWAILDRTVPALLAASITSVGGPLSELPFVANGFWHYIPSASDYFPLQDTFLSKTYDINLALSSITGPCYFAVTMDAIALGRWFDSQTSNNNTIHQ
jgi:hypothetical protein